VFKRWILPGTPPQTRRAGRIGLQNDPLEYAKNLIYRPSESSTVIEHIADNKKEEAALLRWIGFDTTQYRVSSLLRALIDWNSR
jgi:hypothetical protein